MPTYAYECTGCGHAFEVFQKMSDDPLVLCESCGGELKKRVFPVGLLFKGAGFYVNDYARKGKEPPVDSPAAAPKGDTAKGDAAASATPKTPDVPASTGEAAPKA